MTFVWPDLLWSLALLPLLVLLYLWLLRKRRRSTVRLASLGVAKAALGKGPGWRRHVPPLLMLLAIGALLVATARPLAVITLPLAQRTIILAMDVSGSMRATDIKPNRLAAAQEAAKTFVAAQPRYVRVGVVAIAGAAALVQSPTDNREDIAQAIDRFQLQRGSAIGSGLIIALATLLPEARLDVEQLLSGRPRPAWMKPEVPETKPVPPGSNTAAAIVLLSDGQYNIGPDPLEAAKLAASHGVRIFTVGIGTVEGTTLGFEGWSMRVRLDEDLLKRIATVTNADYFQARNAADLKSVYGYLTAKLSLEKKRSTEVTALFVGLGAALAALGAMLSVFWFNRIL
jgi:Ca-activated chloride channel family protein